jgi:putative ABC transport system permease protein
MLGILRLAFKLVVNDRAKFAALLIGITFAVFLMVQITSVFHGILQKSSSTVINIGAPIWVMDTAVQTVANSIPIPDYMLDAVRSIDGVNYAVPLYSGGGLAKLNDGTYQSVTVIGLDDATLYGRPQLTEGSIEDLYGSNAFLVVHDAEYSKLGNPTVGTTFEINDHRAVIVGIAEVTISGLFGMPTLYTTYSRAVQYLPNTRFTYAYILVEPKSRNDIEHIKSEIARLGYLALTIDEFKERVADFYEYRTGLGTNILMMTVVSFLVGMSVSGQTFYSFVLENIEKFGALKAIGAKGHELVLMILFQATFTGLAGYGLGVGLCSLVTTVARKLVPDYTAYIGYSNLGLAFIMVLLIAGISSYIAVRKVIKVEPFDVFRG